MWGSRKGAARPTYRLIAIRHITIMTDVNSKNELTSILDSKHIVTTRLSLYDIKIVQCGEYIQVYLYQEKKATRNKVQGLNDLSLTKSKIDNMLDYESKKKKKNITLNDKIEERSIIRSKLECQRLAKSNMNDWKTFITLTFEENIVNVDYANKRFRYFIDKIKRVKKDLKYLCIPEFQKRGAVHYHLLTNIDINDTVLIYNQEDNPKFKHIKYWIDGFTSVENMTGDSKKVVGYIAKYMTKDIDNRLFNRHRYFYSRNLIVPTTMYLALDNEKEQDFYKKISHSIRREKKTGNSFDGKTVWKNLFDDGHQ